MFSLLLAMTIILSVVLSIWLGNMRDENNSKQLRQSQNNDHQNFPYLAKYVFFYKRMHLGDSGNWVGVFLEMNTPKQFLFTLQQQAHLEQSDQIESIKATIKNRWQRCATS